MKPNDDIILITVPYGLKRTRRLPPPARKPWGAHRHRGACCPLLRFPPQPAPDIRRDHCRGHESPAVVSILARRHLGLPNC